MKFSILLMSFLCIVVFADFSEAQISIEDRMRMMQGQRGLNIFNNASAVRHYRNLINYSAYEGRIGASNAGLVNYFQDEYSRGSCFRNLARSFYSEIKERDQSFPRSGNHLPNGRPSLADRAGHGRFANLRPGWLWRRAMQYSNQNPNLAMSLLGMCGHDDTAHGEFRFDDTSEETMSSLRAQIEELNAQIETEVRANVISKLRSSIAKLQASLDAGSVEQSDYICPDSRSSFMYVPGSLGADVDIPQELKTRIQRAQAPTKGAGALPAKYYHTIGSAFLGCELREKGMSNSNAVRLQGNMVGMYRAYRMCEDKIPIANRLKPLSDHFGVRGGVVVNSEAMYRRNERDAFFEHVFSTYKEYIQKDDECNFSSVPKNSEPTNLSLSCQVAYLIGRPPAGTNEQADRERVRRIIDEYNAARLYQLQYLGGGLGSLSCTNIRMFGPDLERPESQRSGCLPGNSQASCQRAYGILNTWDVDVDWSVTQHRTGADFGAGQCRPSNKSLNDMACEARGSTGDVGTPSADQSVD